MEYYILSFTSFILFVFFFFLISICTYILVFNKHWNNLKKSTYRLQVLTLRTALFLPSYSTLMFLSILFTGGFNILEVLIGIAEALSFICFFALLVENLGGSSNCQRFMSYQDQPYLCACCTSKWLSANKKEFYDRVRNGLKNLLFIRPIIIILQTFFTLIYAENGSRYVRILFLICASASFYYVIAGFFPLVIFFENVYSVSHNISGLKKIVLLKACIVILVLQYLIVEILISSDILDRNPHEIENVYGFIVLWEYAIISVLLYFFYGSVIVENKEFSVKYPKGEGNQINNSDGITARTTDSSSSSFTIINQSLDNPTKEVDNVYDLISKKQFIFDVLNYSDLIAFLTKQEIPLLNQAGSMSEHHISSNL